MLFRSQDGVRSRVYHSGNNSHLLAVKMGVLGGVTGMAGGGGGVVVATAGGASTGVLVTGVVLHAASNELIISKPSHTNSCLFFIIAFFPSLQAFVVQSGETNRRPVPAHP